MAVRTLYGDALISNAWASGTALLGPPGQTAVGTAVTEAQSGTPGSVIEASLQNLLSTAITATLSVTSVTYGARARAVIGTSAQSQSLTVALMLGTTVVASFSTGVLTSTSTYYSSTASVSHTQANADDYRIRLTHTVGSGMSGTADVYVEYVQADVTFSATGPLSTNAPPVEAFANDSAAFTYTTEDSNGTVSVAVTTGALPTGRSLSSAGVETGTYSAAGSYSYTITFTDADGSSTRAFTRYVAPEPTPDNSFKILKYTGTGATKTLDFALDTKRGPVMLLILATSSSSSVDSGIYSCGPCHTAQLMTKWDCASFQGAVYPDAALTDELECSSTGVVTLQSNSFDVNTNGENYTAIMVVGASNFMEMLEWSTTAVAPTTVPHTLGSVPGMVMVAGDTRGPAVHHNSMAANTEHVISEGFVRSASGSYFPTLPTSSVIPIGSLIDQDRGSAFVFKASGGRNLCYAGTYSGNGSATGPTIDTIGWTPRFILIFKSQAGNSTNTQLRVVTPGDDGDWTGADESYILRYEIGVTRAESVNAFEAVSGGFRVATTDLRFNTSGAPYSFLAFGGIGASAQTVQPTGIPSQEFVSPVGGNAIILQPGTVASGQAIGTLRVYRTPAFNLNRRLSTKTYIGTGLNDGGFLDLEMDVLPRPADMSGSAPDLGGFLVIASEALAAPRFSGTGMWSVEQGTEETRTAYGATLQAPIVSDTPNGRYVPRPANLNFQPGDYGLDVSGATYHVFAVGGHNPSLNMRALNVSFLFSGATITQPLLLSAPPDVIVAFDSATAIDGGTVPKRERIDALYLKDKGATAFAKPLEDGAQLITGTDLWNNSTPSAASFTYKTAPSAPAPYLASQYDGGHHLYLSVNSAATDSYAVSGTYTGAAVDLDFLPWRPSLIMIFPLADAYVSGSDYNPAFLACHAWTPFSAGTPETLWLINNPTALASFLKQHTFEMQEYGCRFLTGGLANKPGVEYAYIAFREPPPVPAGTLIPNSIVTQADYTTNVAVPKVTVTNTRGVGTITSAEAIGTPTITAIGAVSPVGIASAQAFGTLTRTATRQVPLAAITSAEAFGTLIASTAGGTQFTNPVAIAGGEALGAPTVSRGAVTLQPDGVASAVAFGLLAVQRGAVAVPVTGVASGEAFGTLTVSRGALTITGIASAGAFGTPAILTGGAALLPDSIASAQALGAPTVSPGAATVQPAGTASVQAFGLPLVAVESGVALAGIASAQAFGTPVVTARATITLAAIAPAEAFGTPDTGAGARLRPAAISSPSVVPSPVVQRGAVTITFAGLPSSAAFGAVTVTGLAAVTVAGIESPAAVPAPTLQRGTVTLYPGAIASLAAISMVYLGGGARRPPRAIVPRPSPNEQVAYLGGGATPAERPSPTETTAGLSNPPLTARRPSPGWT